MKIETARTGLEPELVQRLFEFYHRILDPLNEETPLSQVLDRETFDVWMGPNAIKFFVREGSEVMAFAVLSFDLDHDPLISQPFFVKHYPNRQICHIPALCIDEQFRRRQPLLCVEMVKLIADEFGVPKVLGIFFHSRIANPAMPRLMRLALGEEFRVEERDAMACVLMQRSSMAAD